MVMQSMRKGASGGILKYLLFGMLGMAVGGLALMDVGGVFRSGGVGSNDVAKIADKTIGIREFDGTLRRALSRYGMSTQQAYQIGMTNNVLADEVRAMFLLKEAESYGIEIPRNQMAQYIAQAVKPYQQDGESLQDTLENLLLNQGLNEQAFINGIKREMSADIIKNAIQASFIPNTDMLSKDLYLFQSQTRDIDIVLFPDSDITAVEPENPDQLHQLYESVKSIRYKIPEYRSAQIALYDPEAIDVKFSITDEEIKAAYNENQDSFMVDEQFVLSQAIVQEEEQANAIYTLTQDGKDLKDAVSEIMGDKARFLEDIPFEKGAMLPVLSDALDGKDIGTITPPSKTTLGYHVVKLVDVIPSAVRLLDAVKDTIKTDLLDMKRSDYFYEISTTFDGLLNDSVPFEDIAKEINITISATPLMDAQGLNKEGQPGLKGFDEEDTQFLTQSIFETEDGMQSILQELPSGKFIAVALTDTQSESFKPFEDVQSELTEQFMVDQRRAENKNRMQKYLAELGTGGSTLKSIAKDNKKKNPISKGHPN